jgi:hypothetical protein
VVPASAYPIASGQLTREEIKRCEENEGAHLRLAASKVEVPPVKTKKGPKYTPVSRRHDRPNAVLWLLRNHPELKDSQIMRLVGTTKPTIAAIRERTHWNSPNLQPQDPVTLGLCSQIDLDTEVKAAPRGAIAGRHEGCRRRARCSDRGDDSAPDGGVMQPTPRRSGGGSARRRHASSPSSRSAPSSERTGTRSRQPPLLPYCP